LGKGGAPSYGEANAPKHLSGGEGAHVLDPRERFSALPKNENPDVLTGSGLGGAEPKKFEGRDGLASSGEKGMEGECDKKGANQLEGQTTIRKGKEMGVNIENRLLLSNGKTGEWFAQTAIGQERGKRT